MIARTGDDFRPLTDTYYIPFFDTDVDKNDDWFKKAKLSSSFSSWGNDITPSTK